MSGLTKEIISKTLMELLNEKPLAKITVKDIVERCGVNRNTFYYHFRDIPDVVEYTIRREVDKIFVKPFNMDSVIEGLNVFVDLMGENKKAMLHIYHSMERGAFVTGMNNLCTYVLREYSKSILDEDAMEQEDTKILMHFNKCILTGVFMDWLEHDMSYDLADYAIRLRDLYGDTLDTLLQRVQGQKKEIS